MLWNDVVNLNFVLGNIRMSVFYLFIRSRSGVKVIDIVYITRSVDLLESRRFDQTKKKPVMHEFGNMYSFLRLEVIGGIEVRNNIYSQSFDLFWLDLQISNTCIWPVFTHCVSKSINISAILRYFRKIKTYFGSLYYHK